VGDSFDDDMETVSSKYSAGQMYAGSRWKTKFISFTFLEIFLFNGLAAKFFRVHPPPAFGSSSNLEARALETCEGEVGSTTINDADNSVHLVSRYMLYRFSQACFSVSLALQNFAN
jgi:hypothetical protein